jgi:AraC family transcriptional regulator
VPAGGACFFALQPEHTHPAYLFILHFNDKTTVRLGGKILSAKPGSLSALSPGIAHQELPADLPPRYIAMLIEKRFFNKHYRLYSSAPPPFFHFNIYNADPGLLPVLKRFMIEAGAQRAGTRVLLDALGVEICHNLIRSVLNVPAPNDVLTERLDVSRVIEHLCSHLDDKITVEHMASVARLSPSHFARVFKKETGKAPMEYVQDLRLERAKKMILAGDRTMTEIALACGFNSPSYLSACFHGKFRTTPTEYRKRVNGK